MAANGYNPRGPTADCNLADYAADELEFMFALERFKRLRRRPFPTCTEVLTVLKSLGYRKVHQDPEET